PTRRDMLLHVPLSIAHQKRVAPSHKQIHGRAEAHPSDYGAITAIDPAFLRRRSSIAQRPRMVRRSLTRCVLFVELSGAGVNVGSRRSRIGLISAAAEESNC